MSIETRASWHAAIATLAVLSVTYGAPLVVVVALKPIAAELDAPRSVPALAAALASFGTGLGGILMGWIAERAGVRLTTALGAVAVGLGMVVATQGGIWGLYLGFGALVGLLGNGAMSAPLMTYVTRWFDRRRGTALALIASGQYVAGAIWPSLFEQGIAAWGWQRTALAFAGVEVAVVVPLALLFLRAPPAAPAAGTHGAGPAEGHPVLGLNPNLVMILLTVAIFLCCVPMAQPSVHLVSFCTDLGLSPAHGAAMLSVLLGCAFISRQFWGWVADRLGGLRAVLIGSSLQTVTLGLFLSTQDEIGLFTISAIFGLGFSGIVPGYVLAVRDLFPASEAGWRVPIVLFGGLLGMAAGGWLGGLIYDLAGSYAPAFLTGVATNLANVVLVGALVLRMPRGWRPGRAMLALA